MCRTTASVSKALHVGLSLFVGVPLCLVAACPGTGSRPPGPASAVATPAPPVRSRWSATPTLPWRGARPALFDAGPDFAPCARAAGVTRTYRPATKATGGPPVTGYADLHLHQFVHMAFGGRLVHGSNERWDHIENKPLTRAQALPPRCSGTWLDHGFLIGLEGPLHLNRRRLGQGWPRGDANTHQQIFDEWLEAAHKRGLNLIVMSAVDFEYACRLMPYGRGPFARRRRLSCNDYESVTRQLQAAHDFAKRHPWYRIVTTPRQAREAIAAGQLAVVLHIEVSSPFGTQQLVPDWKARFDELYDRYGVRSVTIAHELDSPFAGAAHHEWMFRAAQVLDNVGFKVKRGLARLLESLQPGAEGAAARRSVVKGLASALRFVTATVAKQKVAFDPVGTLKKWVALAGFARHDVQRFKSERHHPGDGPTWLNARGLTAAGRELTREMMKRHMVVDIAHLGRRAVHDTFCIAEQEFNGYPTVLSHGHLQEAMAPHKADEEKSFPLAFVPRLATGGGIFGIRTSPDATREYRGIFADGRPDPVRVPNTCDGSALSFANHYLFADHILKLRIAFGTDLGGIPQLAPRYPMGRFLRPGPIPLFRGWNGACNPRGVRRRVAKRQARAQDRATGIGTRFDETGLGQIDQLHDLLRQMRKLGVSTSTLESSAEAFLQMWERAYDDRRRPVPYEVDISRPYVRNSMVPARYPADEKH